MRKMPTKAYFEKAKLLNKEEAEQLLARMRGKLNRRVEDHKMNPLEAVARQLELEDENLQEWRERWAEISGRNIKKKGK